MHPGAAENASFGSISISLLAIAGNISSSMGSKEVENLLIS